MESSSIDCDTIVEQVPLQDSPSKQLRSRPSLRRWASQKSFRSVLSLINIFATRPPTPKPSTSDYDPLNLGANAFPDNEVSFYDDESSMEIDWKLSFEELSLKEAQFQSTPDTNVSPPNPKSACSSAQSLLKPPPFDSQKFLKKKERTNLIRRMASRSSRFFAAAYRKPPVCDSSVTLCEEPPKSRSFSFSRSLFRSAPASGAIETTFSTINPEKLPGDQVQREYPLGLYKSQSTNFSAIGSEEFSF